MITPMNRGIARVRVCRISIAAVLLVALLAGCQTRPVRFAHLQAPSDDLSIAPGDVLIFGRLKFVVNGEVMDDCLLAACPLWILERNPVFDLAGFRLYRRGEFSVQQPISGTEELFPNLTTEDDGSFYYVVPAGRYGVRRLGIGWYSPSIYPALEFDVSAGGIAHYLGTVVVDVDVTRYLGGLHGVVVRRLNRLEVTDESPAYLRRLRARYPRAVSLPVRNSLMQPVARQYPLLAPY
jgi:hypothetical protein